MWNPLGAKKLSPTNVILAPGVFSQKIPNQRIQALKDHLKSVKWG